MSWKETISNLRSELKYLVRFVVGAIILVVALYLLFCLIPWLPVVSPVICLFLGMALGGLIF